MPKRVSAVRTPVRAPGMRPLMRLPMAYLAEDETIWSYVITLTAAEYEEILTMVTAEYLPIITLATTTEWETV